MNTSQSETPDPSGLTVDEAVRVLLRSGGAAYRRLGAPYARFVHVDRLPCLLPLLAGAAVAMIAAGVAAWEVAGGALLGGFAFAAVLWLMAPVPHVQAVLADRLILRRWWLAPKVLRAHEVKRLFQINAVGRDGRYRRSLFEVEAVPEGADKPLQHRFIIGSQPVAEKLRSALEAAGFTPQSKATG